MEIGYQRSPHQRKSHAKNADPRFLLWTKKTRSWILCSSLCNLSYRQTPPVHLLLGQPEEHQLATPVSIIKLVLEPPKAYCPDEDVWLISLQIAFILDEIRYVRNQSFDQGIHMNGRCLSLLVFYSFNKDWSLYIYIYIYCLLPISLWPSPGLLLLIFVFLFWSINDIK